MKRRKRVIKIVIITLVILLCAGCFELYRSSHLLETTYYTISLDDRITNNIRIVQLTDLHDSVFGKNNRNLISAVSDATPDVIFITGDLVNSRDRIDSRGLQEFLSELTKISPVYISLGNQDVELVERGTDIAKAINNAGAVLLDSTFVDLLIKGDNYRIGGIYGYCQPVTHAIETHRENESSFLAEFQDTNKCKLLLCHIPVSWCNSFSLYDWDVDVVFSGHIHGGQVRIPVIGGVWAPDMGWFPGRVSGIYTTTEAGWVESRKTLLEYANYMKYDTSYYEEHTDYYPSYLVLSRGLGNTDWMPRFNNVPEIVVVDLVPNDTTRDN